MKFSYKLLKTFTVVLLLIIATLSSCKKYVDIDVAPGMLSVASTYSTDASATSAILGIYSYYPTIYSIGYFSYLGGLDADELQNTTSTALLEEFSQSAVSSTNTTNSSYLWVYPYQVIREVNLVISGIDASTGMTPAGKNQLLGEAKFFRALMFFNLVNYMGGVPLSINASELDNAKLPRSTTAQVYAQIISDLTDAEKSLSATYAGIASAKARVNKWAAAALLARVYLYTKDYTNAEAQSTLVINSEAYSLSTLNNTFLNTSTETILQLSTLYGYSTFGSVYRSSTASATIAPPPYVLYTGFTKSFETGDQRKSFWVDSTTYNGVKYYRINKYKLSTATAGNEYNVVLRLAEQYLIRSEARAQLANVSGSQADLNVVRTRAGLANTTAATTTDLLTAILKERKVELFGEYSHRWFDLKRSGQADAVLGSLKNTWKPTAVLTPIPYNEILLNPNLAQNPGY